MGREAESRAEDDGDTFLLQQGGGEVLVGLPVAVIIDAIAELCSGGVGGLRGSGDFTVATNGCSGGRLDGGSLSGNVR